MKHILAHLLFTAACSAPLAMLAVEVPAAARPFPQHVKYAPGSLKPNQRTQAQFDGDVREFYELWKKSYLREAIRTKDGQTMFRVTFGKKKPEQTVSEGEGYGMVIVALMAGHDPSAQELFDGLHAFALANPSSKDPRLMNWQVPGSSGKDSAFDGDADIAYALLLADAQWGKTRPDYALAARERLSGMLASTVGPRTRLPLLGDWVEADGKKHNQSTPRSSDFMPGHFRAFAHFTADKSWNEVATACERVITALQASPGAKTGLVPDFITDADTAPQPAPPRFLEGKDDGAFAYNAGRVPWRLGTDALLNPGVVSALQARRISATVRTATGGNPKNLHAGYQLDGTPLKGSDYFTTFFAAPLGVAAMLDPEAQAWLDALYNSVRARHEDYFEDTVNLLCLLVMTNNFWQPPIVR